MKKQKAIAALRKEKHLTVITNGPKITVVREFGNAKRRTISFNLISQKDGFLLEHPSYVFVSTVSHFRSLQEDVRLSLNKSYLSSMVNILRKTGIWSSIINKNFLVINDRNRKSHKGKVKKELKNMLS